MRHARASRGDRLGVARLGRLRRRRNRARLAGTGGLAAVAAATLALPAPAAPATAPSDCSQTPTFTCKFTTAGEHSLTIPAGVPSVHVVAVGASGDDLPPGLFDMARARGAIVEGDLPVHAGETLYAEIGGKPVGAFGGFNGGGAGGGGGGVPAVVAPRTFERCPEATRGRLARGSWWLRVEVAVGAADDLEHLRPRGAEMPDRTARRASGPKGVTRAAVARAPAPRAAPAANRPGLASTVKTAPSVWAARRLWAAVVVAVACTAAAAAAGPGPCCPGTCCRSMIALAVAAAVRTSYHREGRGRSLLVRPRRR